MKTVKKISLLFMMLFGSFILLENIPTKVSNRYKSVAIGSVKEASTGLLAGQHIYPLFEVADEKYVTLSELRAIGVTWTKEEDVIYLDNSGTETEINRSTLPVKGETVYMYSSPIYCGPVRSYCLRVQEEILIPLDALQEMWQVSYYQKLIALQPKINGELMNLLVKEKCITNKSDHIMALTLRHLFFQKDGFSEQQQKVYLEPGQSYLKNISTKDNQIYITTFITPQSLYNEESLTYGQKNAVLFQKYIKAVRGEALERLFPKHHIKATMKYAVGKLEAKAEVQLWRSEKRYYYVVIDEKGKKIQVPYDSINILGESTGGVQKVKAEDIEDFVAYKELTSSTPYLIWTDICRQRIYVLKKEGSLWHLEKNFICSSGKNNNLTPTGLYQVEYSFPYFGLEKGYRCKNALVFYKDYMFHSILFDRTGKYIKSGQYDLGRRVSHGCVRLSEEDSAWLYKHIPVGTTVWVR